MSEKLLDLDKIVKEKNPSLYRYLPQFLLNSLKRVVRQKFVNDIIADYGHMEATEFCSAVVKQMKLNVIPHGLENIPDDGGVYLVGNHPLGGTDAMALVHILKNKRPDLKFIVNDILLGIKPLSGMFHGVNKHGKTAKESLQKVNSLLAGDDAVFIFPAGLVSRKYGKKVEDIDWQKTFVTRAKRNKKLVVPVFIDGKLSNFFYNISNGRVKLGIKMNFEMLFLVREMEKQVGNTINIYFGKPIDPSTFDKSKNDKEWAQTIKEQAYLLDKV